MHIVFERPDPKRVLARLREGGEIAEVYGWQPEQAADGLLAALESAQETGYGDCDWLEPTGQYWWMIRLEHERLEIAVMHSTGVGRGWQHVFRAADEVTYVRNQVRDGLARLGLVSTKL